MITIAGEHITHLCVSTESPKPPNTKGITNTATFAKYPQSHFRTIKPHRQKAPHLHKGPFRHPTPHLIIHIHHSPFLPSFLPSPLPPAWRQKKERKAKGGEKIVPCTSQTAMRKIAFLVLFISSRHLLLVHCRR